MKIIGHVPVLTAAIGSIMKQSDPSYKRVSWHYFLFYLMNYSPFIIIFTIASSLNLISCNPDPNLNLNLNLKNQQQRLTETIFYGADRLIYTPEFCSNIKAKDLLVAIKPDLTKESKKKSVAFKVLFDGCRGTFMHDALMAKQIIIPMVDTENTDHLPLLLDQPNLLDLNPEIENIVQHLFTLNINPSEQEREFFFQVRSPERALAILLAFTKVSKENLGVIREMLENLRNHPSPSQYSDAKCVDKSIDILDNYLNSKTKETGDRKLLPKYSPSSSDKSTKGAGSIWMTLAVIAGIGSILAIVLGLLWKFKGGKGDEDAPYEKSKE